MEWKKARIEGAAVSPHIYIFIHVFVYGYILNDDK